MRIIAFVTDAAAIERILIDIGEPRRPLRFLIRDSQEARLPLRCLGIECPVYRIEQTLVAESPMTASGR